MKTISTTLKNAFEKDNIVERDYIILTGTTDRIYLWFKYYDDCYKDGNIVQNFIMKRIEFDYADNDVDFKQKEFKAYKEYKLEDGNWEVIDYGTFIVADIEQSDTKESVKITAYDCALKFANPYVTDLNYASGNITVLDVLYECCTKCGVETDLTSFTNSDFIVDSNQFGDTAQFGNVISAIAGISGNFAKIIGDKLTLKFTNETDEIIESKNYEEFEDKRDTHPITIVGLGISNIEGENVVQRWEEGVAEYGENYMMINDNPFAYTQEKRQQLLPALYNKLKGFAYSSMTLKNCLKPYYECGDLVKVKNKDGNLVDTIILRTSLEGVACNFEAPSITKANVEYANQADALTIAKRTEIEVDKQQGQITSVVQQQDETSSKLAQQQADINGVKTNIENEVNGLNTKYNAITADVNQFKVDVGQKNGNNLLRNSAMKSGTDYWLKEPIMSYYSGDEPPENPFDLMYWYCTQDKNEFERGIFYQYVEETGIWNKTNATKEYFGNDNLLANVSAAENELARQNTISGTIITANGRWTCRCITYICYYITRGY